MKYENRKYAIPTVCKPPRAPRFKLTLPLYIQSFLPSAN